MANRPYFNTQTDQLQALYESANGNQRLLKDLADELRFRNRHKAKALKAQVDSALKSLNAGADKPYPPPAPGTGYKPPDAPPLEPHSPPSFDRISVECAHCKTTNFVSTLDGVTQNLSCASCRAPYEAVFKYGVMRTKFEDTKTQKSQPPMVGWFLVGTLILIVILLMVK